MLELFQMRWWRVLIYLLKVVGAVKVLKKVLTAGRRLKEEY